mgnify:FL=1
MCDRQTERGDQFFHILEVMKRRENMKVASRPMNSVTIPTSLRSGSNNGTRVGKSTCKRIGKYIESMNSK